MELNRIEQTRLRLIKEGKKIIDLSSGNPGEFGIIFPKEILAKAFQNFQDSPVYSADPKGNLEARAAIADFYVSHGSTFSPPGPYAGATGPIVSPRPAISSDNILLTSGTSESYLHLFKLLARPGDEILFPNPSYPLFDHLAQLANINLNYYELDANNGWQLDPKNLESRISEKTKAIVIISPNNPTGSVLNNESLSAILSIANKHNLPIISDEVFHVFQTMDTQLDINKGCEATPSLEIRNLSLEICNLPLEIPQNVQIFTLNGISKTYALPGLKLSWIAITGPCTAEYLQHLELSIDTLLACNQISQSMLPFIIKEGENFLQTYCTRVQKSRETAIRVLSKSPNISFIKPAGGFHLFAEIKNFRGVSAGPRALAHEASGTDEEFVIQMMERTGIFVHPGYFYDYEKGLHVLISCLMEAPKLESVLDTFVKTSNELCRTRADYRKSS